MKKILTIASSAITAFFAILLVTFIATSYAPSVYARGLGGGCLANPNHWTPPNFPGYPYSDYFIMQPCTGENNDGSVNVGYTFLQQPTHVFGNWGTNACTYYYEINDISNNTTSRVWYSSWRQWPFPGSHCYNDWHGTTTLSASHFKWGHVYATREQITWWNNGANQWSNYSRTLTWY